MLSSRSPISFTHTHTHTHTHTLSLSLSLFFLFFSVSLSPSLSLSLSLSLPTTLRSYVYPPLDRLGVYSQWWWTYTRVFTDTVPGTGACGVRWLAELLFRGGTPSIHTYMFSQPTVCDVLRGGVAMCTLEMAAVPGTAITAAQAVTVPHAMEVSYAFGTTSWFPLGEQIGLSLTMSSYWSNFAKSRGGDPNGPGLPRWEAFNIESDLSQQLEESNDPGGGVRSIPRVRKAACDWQSVNPVQTTI